MSIVNDIVGKIVDGVLKEILAKGGLGTRKRATRRKRRTTGTTRKTAAERLSAIEKLLRPATRQNSRRKSTRVRSKAQRSRVSTKTQRHKRTLRRGATSGRRSR